MPLMQPLDDFDAAGVAQRQIGQDDVEFLFEQKIEAAFEIFGADAFEGEHAGLAQKLGGQTRVARVILDEEDAQHVRRRLIRIVQHRV